MSADRFEWHARVLRNIKSHGLHITLVRQRTVPRFAYTIGLSQVCGYEAILAGAGLLSARDVGAVLNELPRSASSGAEPMKVDGIGEFEFADVDPTWRDRTVLGALDLYGPTVGLRQLVPTGELRTIDVPDMTCPWSVNDSPAWTWLDSPWTYDVPESSIAMTNVEALRGAPITEAARWEPDYWELFAGNGPDVSPVDAYAVPIGVLLGADPSLEPVLALDVESAIARDDSSSPWWRWERNS